MSALETAAMSVTPPVAGKNTWVRTTVTSQERAEIPAEWRGAYLTIHADGEAVYFCMGSSTVAAVVADRTTLTSGAYAAHAAGECVKIEAGQKEHIDMNMVSASVTHWSHISPSVNGVVRIVRSSGRVGV